MESALDVESGPIPLPHGRRSGLFERRLLGIAVNGIVASSVSMSCQLALEKVSLTPERTCRGSRAIPFHGVVVFTVS